MMSVFRRKSVTAPATADMENSASREHLNATLLELGIDLGRRGGRVEIISEAPPDDDRIAETYARVNELLGQSRVPVRIRHITGEARALADASHRRVLRRPAIANARLACSFNPNAPATGWEFLANEHAHWEGLQWFDLVDMLSLLAEPVIELRRLREPQPIHYSLFGDDLLLLQDKHDHPTPEKWVWFIRSKRLVAALSERTDELLDQADLVAGREFAQILAWLYSYETVMQLARLGSSDEAAADVETDIPTLEKLGKLGLVADRTLTSAGRNLLEQLRN